MGNIYRKDYVTDNVVIIAEGRNKRPTDFVKRDISVDKNAVCPFCRGNEKMTPPTIEQIGSPWDVRCFRNKFPATDFRKKFRKLSGLFGESGAAGDHEVIVDTPEHGKEFGHLPVSQIEKFLGMVEKRIDRLSKKWEYVVAIHNYGKEAGASLSHLHAQLFALPFVPPYIAEEAKGLRTYLRKKGRCAYCEVVRKEIRGPRLVFQTSNFAVFTPWAPKFPYETWIMPKNHARSLHDISLKELAQVLHRLFSKYSVLFENLPYNIVINYSPKRENYHLNLKVLPRLSMQAGLEFGSGVYVCQMSPESAAKALRAAKA